MRSPPAHPTSIHELLRGWVEDSPAAPALVTPGAGPVSYERLARHGQRVANVLRANGIRRSDRVAVVLPNGPELAGAFVGIASAAAFAPLNPAYREAELDFYLSDLDAKALVTGRGVDSLARELAAARGLPVLELPELGAPESNAAGETDDAVRPDDVALVLHTSGTTSRPKMVPLTHSNLCASARNIAGSLGLEPQDRCLNIMPLFHIHGLVGAVLSSLGSGGSIVCTPGFHAPSFLSWLHEWRPTWYTAVPTMHQAVVARMRAGGGERHSLRFVRSSSAALPVPVLETLEASLGVPVVESYGMTEAAHQMTCNPLPPGERKPGSVGPAAGPEVAILDPRGDELPVGEVGEVAIRGDNVFAGYEGDADANEQAFSGTWFRTGDEGVLDDDGYLSIRGRLKEIINRGGEKISPVEVDEILLRHPAVAQAVAFAVPDPALGEEVGAAAVLEPDSATTVRELQEFVAGQVADFKVPRVIVLVDEIPKGPTGKLQRIGLAERLGLDARTIEASPAPFAPAQSELEEELAALFSDVLHAESVGATDDFFALGGDSLLAAELIARIRDAYGRPHFPLSSLVWAPTVRALAEELERGTTPGRRSLVVPIRAEGDRQPVFFVHALDGEAVRFAGLSRRLPDDQPFYGIRARGVDGDEPPHGSLEEMVSAYVAEVRAVQSAGPYVLGGICMGAPLAVEMAKQLQREGDEVSQLVLIDPRVRARRDLQWLGWQLRLTGTKVRTGDYSWKLAQRERRAEVWSAIGEQLPFARGHEATRAFERQMRRIRKRCVPTSYRGSVVLFVTIDYPLREWFWRPLVQGSMRLEEIPYRHGSVMRPPAVDVLAQKLETVLAEGRSR